MDEYTSEEQQVERIKQMVRDNAPSIIGGLVLGVAMIFGGRAWVDHQVAESGKAAVQYAQVLNALSKEQTAEALQLGDGLMKKHENTPYAALTSLAMAKANVDANHLAAAQLNLRWVLDNAELEPFRHIARQRLIRVLLATGALEDARLLLDEADNAKEVNESFSPGYLALRGEYYARQGVLSMASSSYKEAISKMSPGEPYQQALQAKLADVEARLGKE